jgi:hypothetical protein
MDRLFRLADIINGWMDVGSKAQQPSIHLTVGSTLLFSQY